MAEKKSSSKGDQIVVQNYVLDVEAGLVELAHPWMREPEGQTIGDTRYMVDASGCIRVTPLHADWVLQGGEWKPKALLEKQGLIVKSATPEIIEGAGRRVRTKEEMAAIANSQTMVVTEPAEAPEPEPAPVSESTAITEPAPEETPESASSAIVDGDPEAAEAAARTERSAVAGLDGEPQEIVVSEDMTKVQLLDIAKAQGIAVKAAWSKAQILEAFEDASEE